MLNYMMDNKMLLNQFTDIHVSRLLLVESSASGDLPASGRMATS